MFYDKQLNFRKNFFFIIILTQIFYVYVIDKRSIARCYNVFFKNFNNYSNELCHRIDCVLRKSSHSKQAQRNHERSQISRLFDQYHLIVFEKEINQEGNAHFRKFFQKLFDIKRQIEVSNDYFVHVHYNVYHSIFIFNFLVNQKSRIAIRFEIQF